MTRPIGEPTHLKRTGELQKATRQLQRRPAPTPTSAEPISALAKTGLVSKTLGGNDPVEFIQFWRTPGSGYEPDTGVPSDFVYILLPEDGWYQADFMIFWSTDFGASTFPFIEPSAVIAGTPTTLLSSGIDVWDNTQSWIGGEQFIAVEQDHHSLVATIWFNYLAADTDPSFGIGVNIRSSFAGSKSVGGQVAVTRLGAALEEIT